MSDAWWLAWQLVLVWLRSMQFSYLSLVEQLIALNADDIFGCGVCGDFFLECEIQGLAPMLGSFAGCFLDRLGEEVRFATAAVARLSSITKEMFLEDVTALEFFDEFIDLFDAAPTDVAAGAWGSLSVLVQAIETANSTGPEAVAEVLRDIHVDTLFGEVTFDENSRHFPLQTGWKENATQTWCHSVERAAVCVPCAPLVTFLS